MVKAAENAVVRMAARFQVYRLCTRNEYNVVNSPIKHEEKAGRRIASARKIQL